MTNKRSRAEVAGFLEDGAAPIFEEAITNSDHDLTDAQSPSLVGELIGPYRLLEPLGEGGMSIVYLAERTDGEYQEKVAVKLLRHPGHDSGLINRFRLERQILANLVHPHIARILDGGISESGWPFLVLEHVAGVSLLKHCAGRPRAESLSLFRDVCAAVQHAHRHLIVHRDLKPSNILVSTEGSVKLLDFGIAKLLENSDSHTDITIAHTGTGLRLMTPDYASPEQVRGETITTSTDVYALGVLLYQMLSGNRPYDLNGASPAQIEAMICERDPSAPQSGDDDLDQICLKALRKEPEARYAGAGELADDLQRHARGLPILAQPPTVSYRVRKFLQRNRLGAGAVALIVALSLTFGATMAWQVKETAQARDQALAEAARTAEVTDFLLELFRAGDPRNAGTDTLMVVDLLERGVARADELSAQPDVKASLLLLVGRAFNRLGQYDRAEEVLRTDLANLNTESLADKNMEAQILGELTNNLNEQGRYHDALEPARNSVALRVDIWGDDHATTAGGYNQLGTTLVNLGRYAEAESLLVLSAAIMGRDLGAENPQTMSAEHNLADLYLHQGNYEAARDIQQSLLDRQRVVLGPEHYDVANSLHNLGASHRRLGDNARAEEYYREAIVLKRKILGDSHASVARSLDNLGIAIGMQGRYEESEQVFLEALRMREILLGADHPSIASNWNNLAVLMIRQGNRERAVVYGEKAVAIARASDRLLPSHAVWRANLAMSHDALGQTAEALQEAEGALEWAEIVMPPESPDRLVIMGSLAQARLSAGMLAEADSAQTVLEAGIQQKYGAEHHAVATTLLRRARLLRAQKRYPEARSTCAQALAMRQKLLGDEHPRTAEVWHEMALLLELSGEMPEAIAAMATAVAIRTDKLGPTAAPTEASRRILDAWAGP